MSLNCAPKHATQGVEQKEKELPMDAFCLAMDNHFTMLKVTTKLWEIDVGIVGTAHTRRGWHLKELSNMDNGLVLCVNTLYKVGEIVERLKKCPRTTVKNKQHVAKVWDDKEKEHIFIPTLIDDYNHWMCRVDIVDQWIAHYHPDLRCR
eukprot:15365512-Ditylum_brightwellii.AAC.1